MPRAPFFVSATAGPEQAFTAIADSRIPSSAVAALIVGHAYPVSITSLF